MNGNRIEPISRGVSSQRVEAFKQKAPEYGPLKLRKRVWRLWIVLAVILCSIFIIYVLNR